MRAQPSTVRVAPFGHLRIEACLQLPAAFRSLPRPSSSPEAKGILRSLLFASLFLVLLVSSTMYSCFISNLSESFQTMSYIALHDFSLKLQSLISLLQTILISSLPLYLSQDFNELHPPFRKGLQRYTSFPICKIFMKVFFRCTGTPAAGGPLLS